MGTVFDAVAIVVFLGAVAWVSLDARSREKSVGLWVLFCLLCPPLGLIAYGVVNGGAVPWIATSVLLLCAVGSYYSASPVAHVAHATQPPPVDWVATLAIAGAVLAVGLMAYLLWSALRQPKDEAKPADDLTAPPPEESTAPPPEESTAPPPE